MYLFKWTDFILPTTLQLAPFVKRLLEPVECNRGIEQIQLGLHEALVNAVIHGNLNDSSKVLRVRRITTPNWFVWQIQDQGEGIPRSARCFSLPSTPDNEHGRGLFIIHECFDDVRWSSRGNRLQLACRRS